jgi:RNA polymerase sigma-70 factor, ECF subfamily
VTSPPADPGSPASRPPPSGSITDIHSPASQVNAVADLREASDADLLAAHTAGDTAAFGELFRRHKDRMWAVALRTCADRELAADAVQDGFLAAFRRADSFRGDAAVTTWLHRIVVNACLDRLRRRRRTATLPEHDALEVAESRDEHGSTETRLDVRAALAQLPEGQRLALVLVDMQGLSVTEAAQVLDVAEGTVKSRCGRGRAALAALLGLERARHTHSGGPPGNPAASRDV